MNGHDRFEMISHPHLQSCFLQLTTSPTCFPLYPSRGVVSWIYRVRNVVSCKTEPAWAMKLRYAKHCRFCYWGIVRYAMRDTQPAIVRDSTAKLKDSCVKELHIIMSVLSKSPLGMRYKIPTRSCDVNTGIAEIQVSARVAEYSQILCNIQRSQRQWAISSSSFKASYLIGLIGRRNMSQWQSCIDFRV
jgi:hypothetical protein